MATDLKSITETPDVKTWDELKFDRKKVEHVSFELDMGELLFCSFDPAPKFEERNGKRTRVDGVLTDEDGNARFTMRFDVPDTVDSAIIVSKYISIEQFNDWSSLVGQRVRLMSLRVTPYVRAVSKETSSFVNERMTVFFDFDSIEAV